MKVIYHYEHPLVRVKVERIGERTVSYVNFNISYYPNAFYYIITSDWEYKFPVESYISNKPQLSNKVSSFFTIYLLPLIRDALIYHIEKDTIPAIENTIKNLHPNVVVDSKVIEGSPTYTAPSSEEKETPDRVRVRVYVDEGPAFTTSPYNVKGYVKASFHLLWTRKYISEKEYYKEVIEISSLFQKLEVEIYSSFVTFQEQSEIHKVLVDEVKRLTDEKFAPDDQVKIYLPNFTEHYPQVQRRIVFVTADGERRTFAAEGHIAFELPPHTADLYLKKLKKEKDVDGVLTVVLFFMSVATKIFYGNEHIPSLAGLVSLLKQLKEGEGKNG